jgi:hypothetical protein
MCHAIVRDIIASTRRNQHYHGLNSLTQFRSILHLCMHQHRDCARDGAQGSDCHLVRKRCFSMAAGRMRLDGSRARSYSRKKKEI